MIVANPETLVSIGHLTSHSVLLGVLGFFIIAILASRNIHAAVLVSIVVTTLLGWMLGDVHYTGIVSAPPSVASVIGQVDLAGSLNLGTAGVIFSFMLVNLFDSSGTLIGVTDKAGLADANGKFPRMKQALFVDSVSSVAGSFIGTSSVTAYIESSSGVSVGGRTGLTAVVVGILFLLVIFLRWRGWFWLCRRGRADIRRRADDLQPRAREVERPDRGGACVHHRSDDAV